MLKKIATTQLEIAYHEQGNADGWPVVLLHGFPYDIHTYEEVTPQLVSRGHASSRRFFGDTGLPDLLMRPYVARDSRPRWGQTCWHCWMH